MAAGVDANDYEVWIEPSTRINAFAAAGHTVAVTERAVAVLPAAQLQGVLAHEIGHHLGGHTSMALLRYWYSLPAHYGLSFATYLTMAVRAALESGSRAMTVVVGVVIAGVVGTAFVTAPIVGAVLVVVLITPFLSLWLGRRSEHEADLMAAQIGYRAGLVEYLRSSSRPPPARRGWPTRLTASHPSNSERIRFLEGLRR
ncbi:MAG: M48 family metalloprotease [Actinomycetota bacterium]|nr:M48 family metalloprotease [Actinomycetota bacterium]